MGYTDDLFDEQERAIRDFHRGACRGDLQAVKRFVNNGGNVNVKDWLGRTALHYAAKFGHVDLIRYLVESGAALDAKEKRKKTPLHYAAIRGHPRVVRSLVENGADVNSVDVEKRTPLHLAAEGGESRVVRSLVESGADVNSVDWFGQTALHLAAMQGHFRVVECLVENDANVNVEDKWGKTAVDFLAEHVDPLEHLVEDIEKNAKRRRSYWITLSERTEEITGGLRDAMSVIKILRIKILRDSKSKVQTENDRLKTTIATIQAEKEKLEREIAMLNAENKNLVSDSLCLARDCIDSCERYEDLKNKLKGGRGRENDDKKGNDSVEDGENQQEPFELAGFSNPFNCDVSCGLGVVLFSLCKMGLRPCITRFMMYFHCVLSNHPGANFEAAQCSLSLKHFSEVGLLEEKDVFNKAITDEYSINDALRDAKEKLKGQVYPAVLAMEYANADGTQLVGHAVAMMPRGNYIDVQERRYWEPTPDSGISHIHVVKVKESEIAKWQRHCGLHICRELVEYSTEGLSCSLG